MEVRKPHPIPPEITAKLEELGPLGSGWSLYSCAIYGRQRKMSENQKRKLRRTRLWKRLQKQSPLFAEQFYREKLASNPENYGVTGLLPENYPIPKG